MRKINMINLCFLQKNPKKYVSTPKTDFKKTFEICYLRKIVRASQILHLSKNATNAKRYFLIEENIN